MTSAIDKKPRRYYKTGVSADNPEVFRLAGDRYEQDAKTEFLSGNYKQSFLDHRNAARCYKGALDKLDSNSKDVAYKKNLETMYLAARTEGRKAALYEVTEKKTPLIFRGLMRKIKGRHILASFILALFLSVPNLTGNVIGNKAFVFSVVGASFFVFGIFLSWFFVRKMILMMEKN